MAVLSSVTVNAMSPSPSVPPASEMLTAGVTYRFSIVPVALAVPSTAPEAFDRVTVNVSSLSFTSSSAIGTVIVPLVVPASKVSVPLVAV